MNTEVSKAILTMEPWRCVIENTVWDEYKDGIVAGCEIIASTTLKYVPQGGTVLDYGCGPLNKTSVLASLGYKCTGFDDYVEEWHRQGGNLDRIKRFAASNNITLATGDGSHSVELIPAGPFDMVMMIDVLEHLTDSPRVQLNALASRLAPNGILLIMVPNAGNIRKRLLLLTGGTNLPRFDEFYWHPYKFVGHIREYVRGDLRSMAQFLGLELLELRGVDTMLQKVPKALRPLYLAGTAPFNGLKDTWLMVCRRPPNWSPRLSR